MEEFLAKAAAVLLGPDGILVSHRAGAALRGVGGLTEPTPEVSVPRVFGCGGQG